jgi:60 kDa SS-A/Ro ribonucleoprotein
MKFNFNLKGRGPADAEYTLIKTRLPDAQAELEKSVLAALLATDDSLQAGPGLILLRQTIRQSDRELLARVAIRLREELNFRDLAYLLTAEMSALYNDDRMAQLLARVIAQPGEIPAWHYHFARTGYGKRRPGRYIRKYLSLLLNGLDEYHFTRYGAAVREGLKNALIGLQPRPAGRARRQLFAQILRDQVPVRTSWEQEWHALHRGHYDSHEQRQLTLRDKWKEGISSFRIGYQALLQNLPAMLDASVSGRMLKLAAEYVGNAAAAGPDGQSPLRLLKVWRGLQCRDQGGAGMLMEALERAAAGSSWNRSAFGRSAVSVIAMDVSNSMRRPVCGDESIQRFDIGPLLAYSWMVRGDKVVAGVLGNTWRTIELPSPSAPHLPILNSTDQFRQHEGEAGFAINAWLVIRDLVRKKQVVDKILIFTDCQLWNNRTFNQDGSADIGHWWRQYRRQVAPDSTLYLFDLAGYGISPLRMPEEGVYLLAGWNERFFDVLNIL